MKKTLPVRLGLLESKVCRKGEPIENALDHATITMKFRICEYLSIKGKL